MIHLISNDEIEDNFGRKIKNNFKLNTEIDDNLIVITGINGVGKTRLLENIKLGGTSVFKNDQKIYSNSIEEINFRDSNFHVYVSSNFEESEYISSVQSKINGSKDGCCISDYKFIDFIESKGFDRDALSFSEYLLFSDSNKSNYIVDGNVAEYIGVYLFKKKLNDFLKYQAQVNNNNVIYLTDDEFIQIFGENKFDEINKLLEESFNGKFKFKCKDNITSNKINFPFYTRLNLALVRVSDNREINPSDLSSGEQILLWVFLALYNI